MENIPLPIFIADSSLLIRTGLVSILSSLGIKIKDMVLACSFDDATEILASRSPAAVPFATIFSEFRFPTGQKCSQLFQKLGTLQLKVVLSSDQSDSVIALCAQQGVDLLVAKPLIPDLLRLRLENRSSLQAAHYSEMMKKSAEAIERGNLEGAIAALSAAKNQVTSTHMEMAVDQELLADRISEAAFAIQATLDLRRSQYSCLNQLFRYLQKEGRKAEAARILTQLKPYMTSQPSTFLEAIRLVVEAGRFDDVLGYVGAFSQLEERPDELVKAMAAALSVTGRHFYRAKNSVLGFQAIKAALQIGRKYKSIARQCLVTLIESAESNALHEVESYLRTLSWTERLESEFQGVEFWLASLRETSDRIIFAGWKLLADGVRDPLIYRVMIQRLKEKGMMDPAENLFFQACSQWPELKSEFTQLLELSHLKEMKL